jgi:hypothetical protein
MPELVLIAAHQHRVLKRILAELMDFFEVFLQHHHDTTSPVGERHTVSGMGRERADPSSADGFPAARTSFKPA